MKYVKLNNPSLKYQRLTPTGSRDIRIKTFKFVAKTQILSREWMIKPVLARMTKELFSCSMLDNPTPN